MLKIPEQKSIDLPNAKIFPEQHIFRPTILELIKGDSFLNQFGIIHGDLHPENIMVIDENPYVIDWDLCGKGPIWYDLLSLLSHPHLYLSKEQRYRLFLDHSNSFDAKHLDLLFSSFCQFKEKQLFQFASSNSKFLKLSRLYSAAILMYNSGNGCSR